MNTLELFDELLDDAHLMRQNLRYLSVAELLSLRDALVFELIARGCSTLAGSEA